MKEIQETQVQSLDQEDLLEEEIATHSSTLAWKIPWTEEPGRQTTVHGIAESDMTKHTPMCTHSGYSPVLGTSYLHTLHSPPHPPVSTGINFLV